LQWVLGELLLVSLACNPIHYYYYYYYYYYCAAIILKPKPKTLAGETTSSNCQQHRSSSGVMRVLGQILSFRDFLRRKVSSLQDTLAEK
jgi:hypothetical protein